MARANGHDVVTAQLIDAVNELRREFSDLRQEFEAFQRAAISRFKRVDGQLMRVGKLIINLAEATDARYHDHERRIRALESNR
ncbi:MAG: hypothetical protein HYZ28_27200 [Myxococcales bacterium]|nr:hypothetical protein [Myxococcales bacterium]